MSLTIRATAAAVTPTPGIYAEVQSRQSAPPPKDDVVIDARRARAGAELAAAILCMFRYAIGEILPRSPPPRRHFECHRYCYRNQRHAAQPSAKIAECCEEPPLVLSRQQRRDDDFPTPPMLFFFSSLASTLSAAERCHGTDNIFILRLTLVAPSSRRRSFTSPYCFTRALAAAARYRGSGMRRRRGRRGAAHTAAAVMRGGGAAGGSAQEVLRGGSIESVSVSSGEKQVLPRHLRRHASE